METHEQLGPYKLLRLIGRGGMSSVYEAEDTRIGRRVAVKVMTVPPQLEGAAQEAFVARVRREARAIARLSHPGIVTIFDVGEQGPVYFSVMEYLEGITLAERLARSGPLPLTDAAAIVGQVADALDAVHQQGIVHRDLKPSNLILLPGRQGNASFQVKLLDFGVARPPDDNTVTQAGMLVGTPAYLAPEVAKGGRATPASDIWALGVLLYEMLTGRQPFGGEALPAVLYNVVHETPEPLPEFSESVQQVIETALAKDPNARFGSARELAVAFQEAVNGRVTAKIYPVSESAAIPHDAVTPITAGHRTGLRPDSEAAIAAEPPVNHAPPPAGHPPGSRGRWALAAGVLALLGIMAAGMSLSRLSRSAGGDQIARLTPPEARPLPRPVMSPSPEVPSTRSGPTGSEPRTGGRKEVQQSSAGAVTSTPMPARPGPRSSTQKSPVTMIPGAVMKRPAEPIVREVRAFPAPSAPVKPPSPTPVPRVSKAAPPPPVRKNRTVPQPVPQPTETPALVPIPQPTETPDVQPLPKPTVTPAPDVDDSENVNDTENEEAPQVKTQAGQSLDAVHEELRALLPEWIAAAIAKDTARQMVFYPERTDRYYTLRNVSRAHIERDKARIFGRADTVSLVVRDLTIDIAENGKTAVMRYRKDYEIVGGPGARRGAVLEELHWRMMGRNRDWMIVSERDLRVLSR